VAKTWTCPACGTRNPTAQTECSQCGRWASVFDLDDAEDADAEPSAPAEATEDEWQPVEASEPEPVIPSGPRPTARETVRTVLDSLREARAGPSAGEPETQPRRPASLVKWLVIALALLWFVLAPLLDALR
jgi:Zn-finger in Ran binding protein and others